MVVWGTGTQTKCAFLDQVNLPQNEQFQPINPIVDYNHTLLKPQVWSIKSITIPGKSAVKVPIQFKHAISFKDHKNNMLFCPATDMPFEIIDGFVDPSIEHPFILMVNNHPEAIELSREDYLGHMDIIPSAHIAEVTAFRHHATTFQTTTME